VAIAEDIISKLKLQKNLDAAVAEMMASKESYFFRSNGRKEIMYSR
jgi:hypothetical protein